jgi:3-methyl-2-oxobutanoate hydroxymethyltransferase
MFDRFTPKFVRQYADVSKSISEAVQNFAQDVVGRSFPAAEHTYSIDDVQLQEFLEQLDVR